MNEQRLQAYYQLIQNLLNCPSGEEPEILAANTELLDAGFLQVLTAVADNFAQQGEENAANRLRNLATYLTSETPPITKEDIETYRQFLLEILQATAESKGDTQVIYPLLAANTDKLNYIFAALLRRWATNRLAEAEPDTARYTAAVIGNFSDLIQQFPLGSKANNMEIAITGYKIALTVYTRSVFAEDWAHTQNNLGNAYHDRILGDRAENIENAIAAYHQALAVYSRSAFPVDWAMTQNNLGNAYGQRILGERAENIEKAIAAYHQALSVYTRSAFPEDWAHTQNNLGNAYHDRILGDRAENIENAIAAYHQALAVYSRSAFPVDWAMTQNNLGNAYGQRILGERAENIEKAIAAYHQALSVYTRSAFPEKWAKTQNNLAIAYSFAQRTEDMKLAIAASNEALSVYARSAFPVDWAMTQNNLAIDYSDRILEEPDENIEAAITAYHQALSVYTRSAFPEKWAMTQNNLGNAYRNRIKGERGKNIEAAIAAYHQGLSVYTRSAFPEEWAMTQNNLGNAYRNRIKGERGENIEAAIAAYKNALLVYTRTSFPQSYVVTLFNLGIVYQKSQLLVSAYISLESAIETIEFLSKEIVDNEQTKPDLTEQLNQIYHFMIEVCLELKQYAEAIGYIELTKTRKLIKSLLPRIELEIEAEKKELQKLEKDNKQNISLVNLSYLRQQKEYLISRLDRYNPIRFSDIQHILDGETAIIQFYIFRNCFRVFIITRSNNEPAIWHSNQQDLDALIKQKNEYLKDYKAKGQDQVQWQNKLEEHLKELAEILHLEEIRKLIPEEYKRLILIPHRYLHLFPLHALSVNGSYLIDLFPNGVGYAPSCQLLQQVQLRQRPDFQSFFAIQNPTQDLYEEDLGAVAAIKNQFTYLEILKKDQANKSAILLGINKNIHNVTLNEKLLKANCAFFFCHGYFNSASPQDSGLQLADENLTLADIITYFKLEKCRLVTLSACETGLTDLTSTSGDEYIGLPSGFLLAGSTNVVSSLWIVSTTATALLMIKFYEELQQQKQSNIVLALNTAQRWLRDTTVKGFQDWLNDCSLSLHWQARLNQYFDDKHKNASTKPFESPFYWAAFCNIGKGV
ncbi:MAG: CHAT domain-containing protein [Nostoc sp. DcaGUA01]|nr:CHAT domain-containing protein [Nostoc sp. DcaGUA01]